MDPQDDTVQETQDQTLEEQNNAQYDRYDSDTETVDPRKENEINNEEKQEEEKEVAIVNKKKSKKVTTTKENNEGT